MIEQSLNTIAHEAILTPPSDSPKMLTNEERIGSDITPIQRLQIIDEDTYEELVCVWAYYRLKDNKEKGYSEVYRVGQAGDKGRDVLAYYDRAKGEFDLYQCKHYDHSLTYSDLCGEMGKLLVYTYKKAYPIPKNYYILCPKDVSQSFVDLLSNKGADLKTKLKDNWDNIIKKKVGDNWIPLDEAMTSYIDNFDFDIVKKIEPTKFIDEFIKTPFYFYYFGGGFGIINREPIPVPKTPTALENNYIQNLIDAYSEDAGYAVEVLNREEKKTKKYKNHLNRARTAFYESEEVKIASRKSTAPESDEFIKLSDSVERFVGNELDEEYSNGFAKVKAVENKAGQYNTVGSMLISHLVDSNVCIGICHQLSNENKITWKVKD